MRRPSILVIACVLLLLAFGWNLRVRAVDTQSPVPIILPTVRTAVTITFTQEARASVTAGGRVAELTEVSGEITYFGDHWVGIQTPQTGARMWIPVHSIAQITTDAGAKASSK